MTFDGHVVRQFPEFLGQKFENSAAVGAHLSAAAIKKRSRGGLCKLDAQTFVMETSETSPREKDAR